MYRYCASDGAAALLQDIYFTCLSLVFWFFSFYAAAAGSKGMLIHGSTGGAVHGSLFFGASLFMIGLFSFVSRL